MHHEQDLLERTRELEQLTSLVGATARGEGGVMIVEGEAGIGKTRLLDAARDLARARDFTALSARGGELERDFGHGVVRQLFEAHLRSLPAAERDRLFEGAAAPAKTVLALGDGPSPAPDASVVAEHSLYWLTVDLAARRPLLICVDDAHWSDLASLRWLVYLTRRLEGIAVGVVLGWRQGEPGAPEELLAALRAEPQAVAMTPRELSAAACAAIVRRELGAAAEERFCAACREVSGGNPFLLGELLQAVRAEGVDPTGDAAAQVIALGPTAVARSVLVRLSRLPPAAADLARALAVLDTDAELQHAAAMAELEDVEAVDALGALAAAHIVQATGAPRFAHPILRTAVYRDLAEARRDALHRRAANVLAGAGHADRAAVHLLTTRPGGDLPASRSLRDAGLRALQRGSADTAVALLRRALEEVPASDERYATLLALGCAERFAGRPDAIEHLREAAALAERPEERVQTARELSAALLFASRGEEAIAMLERVIASLPEDEPEAAAELEVELAILGVSVVSETARLAQRLGALAAEAAGETPAQRSLLAAFALYGALGGLPADTVTAVAERAWAGGQLVRDDPGQQAPPAYVIVGLRLVERLDLARAMSDEAVRAIRERGSVSALALALASSAYVAWAQGDPRSAEADAREAVHLGDLAGLDLVRLYALGLLVMALCQAGELGRAEAALAEHDFLDRDPPDHIQTTLLLAARAELRFEQGRYAEAVRDGEEYVRRHEAMGVGIPGNGLRPLALALIAQGDRERARRLVDARLTKAREKGLDGNAAEMLDTLGLIEGGTRGLELLREAAEAAARAPRRHVEAQVLLDLGAALRRARRRRDAREPLRRALEIAHGCGARALARRAHEELLACGARPRRIELTGADSLTASEHRIAGMAAGGATNRQIAQALFITPKTVEAHLRAIFRKLDITSRTEIAAAVGRSQGPADVAESDTGAVLVTVLSIDIPDAATQASRVGPEAWPILVERQTAIIRDRLGCFCGREISGGEAGFLATFDGPTRAVRCACAVAADLADLGLQSRAGIHVGECAQVDGLLEGQVPLVAAGLCAAAAPGQVLASDSVQGLVADPALSFRAQGTRELRGLPGAWVVHAANVLDVADA